MMAKPKLVILFLSAAVVFYCLAGGFLIKVTAGESAYAPLSLFTTVLQKVTSFYVEEPDLEDAFRGAVEGMVEALDPFSSFVDAETYRTLSAATGSASPGILLSKRYGYAYVVAVVPGSPADRESIRSGDLIESIEGTTTSRMSLWEVEARLRGPEGSRVQLRLVRGRRTELAKLELVRENLPLAQVRARMVEPGLGLLTIQDCGQGSAQAVAKSLRMLKSADLSGLLVDLRGNARGEVSEAVQVSDLFLDKGQKIVSIEARQGSSRTYVSLQEPLVRGIPIVLLVDGGTSGAAEVLTAALKDNQIATLVGLRTGGRGAVQRLFPMSDGSVLLISSELFLRANGEPIQADNARRSGVKPDVRSPNQDFVTSFYYENTTEDLGESLVEGFYSKLGEAIEKEQLRSATELLREKVASKAA